MPDFGVGLAGGGAKKPGIVLIFIINIEKLPLIDVSYLDIDAGWSSLAARRAHNPKVVGSNPTPATSITTTPDNGVFC